MGARSRPDIPDEGFTLGPGPSGVHLAEGTDQLEYLLGRGVRGETRGIAALLDCGKYGVL